VRSGDRKLDYRGHSGNQVLKPGSGDRPNLGDGNRPGGADPPNLGGGDRPGGKPDAGQIQQGLKDRSNKQAALPSQKPDVGKAKAKAKGGPGGSAFDPNDGGKAKDFSKRGQASLGNRGAKDFSRPSGGGGQAVRKGGGGGGAHLGGGGRGGGGGGRGGGGRRR
jgi:hypothetical protein